MITINFAIDSLTWIVSQELFQIVAGSGILILCFIQLIKFLKEISS